MTFRLECECGHQMMAKDEYAGRRIRCRECGEPVAVPDPSDNRRRRRGRQSVSESEYDDSYDDYESYDDPPRRQSTRKPKRRRSQTPKWLVPAVSTVLGLSALGAVVVAVVQFLPESGSTEVESVETVPLRTVSFEGFEIDVPEDMVPIEPTDQPAPTMRVIGRGWELDDRETVEFIVWEFVPGASGKDPLMTDLRAARTARSSQELLGRITQRRYGSHYQYTPVRSITINGLPMATRDKNVTYSTGPRVGHDYVYREPHKLVEIVFSTEDESGSPRYELLKSCCESFRRVGGTETPSQTPAVVAGPKSLPQTEAEQSGNHRFNGVQDILRPGTHEVEIYELQRSPRYAELNERLKTATRQNAAWWIEQSKQHMGKPIPYDERLGLSPEEYSDWQTLRTLKVYVPTGKATLTITSNGSGAFVLTGAEALGSADGLQIQVQQNEFRTRFGTGDRATQVAASDRQKLTGRYNGIQLTGLTPLQIIDVGRLEQSGRGLITLEITAPGSVKPELHRALTLSR